MGLDDLKWNDPNYKPDIRKYEVITKEDERPDGRRMVVRSAIALLLSFTALFVDVALSNAFGIDGITPYFWGVPLLVLFFGALLFGLITGVIGIIQLLFGQKESYWVDRDEYNPPA